MNKPIDDYSTIILDDFLDRKRLREKIKIAHLNKADEALQKCINYIYKAADNEQIKLYRLLCYIGSRIEEIDTYRNINITKYPNKHWGRSVKNK